MSDKRQDSRMKPQGQEPKGDEKPHKVDETVQEEAAEERSESGGYD